jgi:ABC-type lipoprotein export system ATPase subunit
MSNYYRGSEWRKWDLHFHTPSSYDVSDVDNASIVAAWKTKEISVVAITDHHEIDVTRIKDLQCLAKKDGITVLPGIEFLSDARGDEPVHFIGIFAEDSNIDHIWGQISNITSIKNIKGQNKKHNEVYCDLIDTIKLVKDLGGIVTIHAGKKTNSIECITNSLPHAMAQKTEIAHAIDMYELGKETDQDGYKKYVFPAIKKTIPMIMCSDNHDISSYTFKQNLWIKADPTFKGLKQAIHEPLERIFIGIQPDVMTRVATGKTHYIKSLLVSTVNGRSQSDQIWFDQLQIPINAELTAIIGNKGSGKSAIADIIGLCTDANHQEYFQFLSKDKFKKKGFAERFDAAVEFESDIKTERRTLDYNIKESDTPKIQYLPQNYYEKVCNEIERSESFRAELENVVFQYVKPQDRLGSKSFKDLVQIKKVSVDSEISSIATKINEINSSIIILENKNNSSYKESILSKLKLKNEELVVHESNRPVEPETAKQNSGVTQEASSVTSQIQGCEKQLEIIIEQINVQNQTLKENNLSIQMLQQLKRDVIEFNNKFEEFCTSKKAVCEKYNVNISDIISFSHNTTSVDHKIKGYTESNLSANSILGNEVDAYSEDGVNTTLYAQKAFKLHQIAKLRETLSQSEQIVQKYHSDLKMWNELRMSIIGSADIVTSIEYYKTELEYLEKALKNELDNARSERNQLSLMIFKKKVEIKKFYDEIKHHISEKLKECDGQNLEIVSSLVLSSDFSETFLGYISQNKAGSFYGSDDGKKRLREYIQQINWNNEESVVSYLSDVIDHLERDKRDKFKNETRFIGDQIKDRENFYRHVFCLDYLKPYYELQKDNKTIESLSPGEKGALLLVFYLVLDQSTIPLIIDQPEDNLDNNSVAKVLVPFIRNAKKRRQIIMVTHNPNLAVVADAEQIIRTSIDKENGNRFSYTSGSIENPEINEAIVDVLEGTMPAFNTRKIKYH